MTDRVSLRHPVALAGVVIATVSAVAFLTLVAADLLGMFTNPYAGLVIFIAVPALFVLRPAADSAGHLAAAPGAASRPLDAGRLAGHRPGPVARAPPS